MNNSLSPREFALLQKYIEEHSGIELGAEKAYLIESRLSGLLENYSLGSYEELFYKAYSRKDVIFTRQVFDAITTNETFWFRDKTPWYIMEDLLLPQYIREMQAGRRVNVRIWSCACSSGQEPYSIAMSIDSFLKKNGPGDIGLERFKIMATDLSGSILDLAKSGRYDSVSMERGLDPVMIDRYFTREGNRWLISERIKRAVDFRQFNLKTEPIYSQYYDIIFCRNVLIYFSELTKENILHKIINALKPQGVLFIGASEIIKDASGSLEMDTYQDGVYFRLKG
ncbi:MAG: protein-glutamate O-methyltransferase CheR [Syntrophomonadaceae bacterium]|nr:protein-glutamate O-methyltransferase CheR [Syntrophomonadaceae bacterium]